MAGILRLGRERTLAVVDIGSGNVGCAIVSKPAKGRAVVISHARSKLTLEERTADQSRARIAEEIIEATSVAWQAAVPKVNGSHVSSVYVILHAPWSESRTVWSSERFEKQSLIHEALIGQLAQEALASAPDLDRARLFEASVLSVELNGYPTANPEGKLAAEVRVAAIASTADMQMKATVEASLQTAFPASKILWRSSSRINAEVLQHREEVSDALVISVGLLATQCVLVRERVPMAERVIPEGLSSILARVHTSRPPQETLGLFRMLARDACADEACTALQAAISAMEPDLVKIFGENFSALAQERRLPTSLILIAQNDVAPWLQSFFERIDFTQFTVTALPFSITVLDADHLQRWIQNDNSLDAMLALDCAGVSIEEQST